MRENDISAIIVGCALEVHKQLGPGLLESAYEACLIHELKTKGLKVQNQLALPLVYKDARLDIGYRLDILVENLVIIEIKSVESITDIHIAQVLTYLKLKNLKLALLINFNSILIKDGIRRLVNKL